MSKYRRSRHIPLQLDESNALKEETSDFLTEIQEAGTLLKTLRESKGWTEAELGEKVGMDPEHIALMERGQQPVPFVTAQLFSKLFSTDSQLFL
jgi:ribosome-binding protein aMBF1 (putative translation factor)